MHVNSKNTGDFVTSHPEQLPTSANAADETFVPQVMTDPPPEQEQVEQPSRLWPLVREIIETVLLAAIIWLAVNFATARYVVDGQSMEPNLHTGQFLIVSRLAYKFGSPQRGDIIVFEYPGNTADDYVKRIVGLPGETVMIENGKVYVNGEVLDEPYLTEVMPILPYRTEWPVPERAYFVLGDNRAHSSDSRAWGFLQEDLIVGKAWFSYWPPEHWGFIPHYEYDE